MGLLILKYRYFPALPGDLGPHFPSKFGPIFHLYSYGPKPQLVRPGWISISSHPQCQESSKIKQFGWYLSFRERMRVLTFHFG
jgi:hypothetical protein